MRATLAVILLLIFASCLLPSALLAAYLAEASDDLFDEPVRRRGSGGDADAHGPAQVFGVYLVGRLDEKTFFALLLADREQLQAVRRVAASDDVESVNVSGQRPCGVLSVARRGADGVDDLRLAVGFGTHGIGGFEESSQLERGRRDHERREK